MPVKGTKRSVGRVERCGVIALSRFSEWRLGSEIHLGPTTEGFLHIMLAITVSIIEEILDGELKVARTRRTSRGRELCSKAEN